MKECFNNNLNLREVISRQNNLIKLSDKLQDIFGTYIMIFISSSGVLMSILCFYLVVTRDFAMLIPFLLTTFNQVYLLCRYGQKLHDSSSLMFDGISESNWYELQDKRVKKIIPFMLQRNQQPKILKVFGFSTIKLSTFRSVSIFWILTLEINFFFQIIYSAYSYFTVLDRIYSKVE